MFDVPTESIKTETERINALKRYDILDTPPDGSFDHITKLASRFLNVPIAIVSLVDTDRIWFKSHYGLDVHQLDREAGLCSSAILSDELYVVENAITDPRALSNSLVAGEFGLRFYAAIPIKVRGGFNLGTLCVIDKKPRTISKAEKDILTDLAEIIVDQLELRLEARKASESHNQMLGMVAHELKNPLTTIPLYTGLLKEKLQGKEDLEQMCCQIEKASKRMQSLIHEVLETARLQANEIHLKKKHLDLAVIVARVTAINLILANAKQQKLYLDIADNIMLHADETKMTEIFDNLISNAIKYSPVGSEISVKLKALNQMAIFEVTDQGPGFSEEDKKRLFMPFTRLSARPTAGENSTGIGLSIVKILVQAHDGHVTAKNRIGEQGAHFIVEIPTNTEN